MKTYVSSDPDIPDPAQLDLLSCFDYPEPVHNDQENAMRIIESVGTIRIKENDESNNPAPDDNNPYNLSETQLKMARSLRLKSKELPSKRNNDEQS